MQQPHYLEEELNTLFQSDLSMWHFLQEASLDGVWYWDLERPEIEWMSPKFWQTFGFDPATKKHEAAEWQDLIFEEDLALAIQNFDAHCADPNHPYDQMVRYRHADGSTVWVRCRGLAIRDDTGKPIRMLGAHTNMTAAKLSEADALAGWRASEMSDRGLHQVAANVQTNVLRPFREIRAALDTLKSTDRIQPDAETADILTTAVRQADAALPMIDDLITYSECVNHSDRLEPVDLEALLDTVRTELKDELSACHTSVEIGELSQITGLKRQLHILFRLLIQNALAARLPGIEPLIVVSQRREANSQQVEITISDNGQSVPTRPASDIINLMELRQPPEIRKKSPLAPTICQRIAHNHKTEITARNFGGKRAAFSITLDAAD